MEAEMKPFKILSIDGGGIKGLYSATILNHLEQKYGRISDYFDMICGTSTGGLIALGLSQGIAASEICNMYEKHGSKIFPNQSRLKAIFKQVLWGGKFSDKPLKNLLQDLFKEKKVGDSLTLLCIPSYNYTDAQPWVFKYDHGELKRDNKALCVDVALATSAAPTYFPLCDIEYYDNRQFVDGGVWANNPAMVGVLDALRFFVGSGKEYNSIEILSVSSLNNIVGKPIGLKRNRSFLSWREELFETSLIGQNHFTDYMLKMFSQLNEISIKYTRVPSEEISGDQRILVKLDCATDKAIKFIKGKGNIRGLLATKDHDITSYFKNQKTYKTQ